MAGEILQAGKLIFFALFWDRERRVEDRPPPPPPGAFLKSPPFWRGRGEDGGGRGVRRRLTVRPMAANGAFGDVEEEEGEHYWLFSPAPHTCPLPAL